MILYTIYYILMILLSPNTNYPRENTFMFPTSKLLGGGFIMHFLRLSPPDPEKSFLSSFLQILELFTPTIHSKATIKFPNTSSHFLGNSHHSV